MRAAIPLIGDGRIDRLTVVGDGAERDRLRRMVAACGVAARVEFTGRRTHAAIVRELERAAVVVFPSIWPEDVPARALEALALGRPIVGSAVGAIPELIEDGVNGRLVAAGDPGALGGALAWVLEDGARREALSRRSAEMAARFDVDRLVTDLERHYSEVVTA